MKKKYNKNWLNIYKQRSNREYDKSYMDWRKSVLKRDNYRCQFPNCKLKARHVHHIQKHSDNPILSKDPNNGISLCVSHHKLTYGNEAFYIKMFIGIVNAKLRP